MIDPDPSKLLDNKAVAGQLDLLCKYVDNLLRRWRQRVLFVAGKGILAGKGLTRCR